MAQKILVVDDEPSIVKLIKATLEARGYQVVTAFDGLEALTEAKTQKPDLIVLDVMMPHVDGLEARKRLLADPKTADIPVIHLSAIGDYEQQLKAVAHGVTDYVTKPFAPSELAQRVADMLDPAKREKVMAEHRRSQEKLRAIVDIMHHRHP
jgi:two-component system, OmpR family, alkaline phosphatase synthesis response regulator PhoP